MPCYIQMKSVFGHLEPSDVDVLMRLENDEELWENGIVTGPFSRFQLERYIAGKYQ